VLGQRQCQRLSTTASDTVKTTLKEVALSTVAFVPSAILVRPRACSSERGSAPTPPPGQARCPRARIIIKDTGHRAQGTGHRDTGARGRTWADLAELGGTGEERGGRDMLWRARPRHVPLLRGAGGLRDR
jgi:hypothetical protein